MKSIIYIGEGSLTINVQGHKSLVLAKEVAHVFDSEQSFKPYKHAVDAWKNLGKIKIVDGAVAKPAPVEPVKAVPVEPEVVEPKEDKVEEVKVEAEIKEEKKEEAPAEVAAPAPTPSRRGRRAAAEQT